jgi:hypothetical protein
MYTRIKNGKRCCINPAPLGQLISWDYIKQVLIESGFIEVQTASPSEYIMRGCEGTVLVYVKFPSTYESAIVFLNESEHSNTIRLKWEDESTFAENGDCILEEVRNIWRAL